MAEKQQLYGFVTRLPKDSNELAWRTTGFQGANPEGSYQYEFSDHVGWKQPIFTQLDYNFFMSKTNDYRVEAVAGREARPQRPVRDVEAVKETKPVEPASVLPNAAPKVVDPSFERKKMGRPPKIVEVSIGA